MGQTAVMSDPPKPAKTKRLRPRRWSPEAFALAWRQAKKADPSFRTMDLANAVDRTPTTVYNWRKGIGTPDVDQALALAAILGCDLLELTE